ncbi:DNA-(apurinic or apyrimidinic site) lyase [Tamilnaduibacter salinus]|uniref:Formamidopyrimidine-DNA glycosylase n=1 Tax=Tamilnaduibacter salinus TaxID=1484056 RepID=A0A2U1CZ33_9GAMM|nr:bifunctional DNA-formamidopyrimidine glycosylase/DNA-(apurinic or apyrimidinic site) lyase [Tamilnaduibacter salinus]PVY77640.1 DNA-(apurinic or apyrimidinic site) lyase [Tamilnaduibacter salinus]
MPELPEVETTRRGIEPHLTGRAVTEARVLNGSLRWPVPEDLPDKLISQIPRAVERRAKYLLIRFDHGTAIVHLGMSGSLRVITDDSPLMKHDHIELTLEGGQRLRYNDPRRFGSWHWTDAPPEHHALLAPLGPEPLSPDFTGDGLYHRSRGRRMPIKAFIMDSRTVVGVGNIYACEALFMAGIHPQRAAGRVSQERYRRLVSAIRDILSAAILDGGTTLRDFVNSEGKPGYFAQSLSVYGRGGEPCHHCGRPLRDRRLGQRATVYCPRCQR